MIEGIVTAGDLLTIGVLMISLLATFLRLDRRVSRIEGELKALWILMNSKNPPKKQS